MNTEVFCNYTCIYYRYAHGEVKLTTSSSGPHSFLIYDLGLYFGLDNFYIKKKKIRLRAMISDPYQRHGTLFYLPVPQLLNL